MFGSGLIQCCQVHKLRNILEHLPEGQRPCVRAIAAHAYSSKSMSPPARRLQHDLAPSRPVSECRGQASREGLDDTLAILTLGLPDRLQQSVATTNAIESLISLTSHMS